MPATIALAMRPRPIPRMLGGKRQARTTRAAMDATVPVSHSRSTPRQYRADRRSAASEKTECSSTPERCSEGTVVRVSSQAPTTQSATQTTTVMVLYESV